MDILASAGALSLLPENAGFSIRLEALAWAAAALQPHANQRPLGLKALRKIFREPELAALRMQEDPCDNAFSEALTSFGGSYIMFPGITEDACYILRALEQALFLHVDPIPDREFIAQAKACFAALLHISDAIARRAHISRNMMPIAEPDIRFPHQPSFSTGRAAVMFSYNLLSHTLAVHGVTADIIEMFILDIGSAASDVYDPNRNPLLSRPLVRSGDDVVVPLPSALAVALRHAIISLAIEANLVDELSSRFRDYICKSVIDSFHVLRVYESTVSPRLPANDKIVEKIFRFDTDKLMHVMILSDDLCGYDITRVDSRWHIDKDIAVVRKRQQQAESALLSLHGCNEVFMLFVFQPIGRYVAVALKHNLRFGSQTLICKASELDIISHVEYGNPLLLWKYACAQHKLRLSAQVMSFGQLDEFQVFRSNGHSYYFSDDQPPTGVSFAPGNASALIDEDLLATDRHAASSYHLKVGACRAA